MISHIFPRTGRISGPEVGDGSKPEVSRTHLEKNKQTNKKKKGFYEASPLKNIKALHLKATAL